MIWGRGKFLRDSRNLLQQVPDLLDRGLVKSCSEQVKKLIQLCEQKKRGKANKELWRIYAQALCLYEQGFSRFGRKSGSQYLKKAAEVAQENDFADITFWVNQCRLEYAAICGRTKQVQELKQAVFECLKKLESPSEFEVFCLPALARDALNQGDFPAAGQWAKKLLELSSKFAKANLLVQANVLLSKAVFGLKRREEALSYLNKAVSLGQEKKVEQLIPALYNTAEVFLGQDNIAEARRYLKDSQQRLNTQLELPDSYYHIHLLRLQGLLAQKEKKSETAEECFNQAVKIANSQENPLEQGLTQLKLGQLYMELKNFEKATIALEEASGKFIIIDNPFQLSFAKDARQALKESRKKPKAKLSEKQSSPARPQAEMLDEFMKLIISNLDLDAVLNNVIGYIMKVTDADRGFLILLDETGKLYSQVFRAKEKFDQKKSRLFRKFSQSITEEVLKHQKSICLTDAQGDARFANSDSVVDLDIRSVICAPLKKEQKEMIGLIYIDRHSLVNAFGPDDLTLVESLADYAAIALVNARLHSGVQKKLESTEAQLIQSEKMATVGVLAGGVAHEINTPLGAILLNTEMLLKQMESKSYKKMLKQIEGSTQRCKQIIEMLLQYSRKTNPKYEQLDLNQVIDRSCTFLEQQLIHDNIHLSKEQKKLSPVEGNFNELMQVFTNLLVNAKEAIKSVKESGTIIIKSFQDGNFAIAQVKDDGVGIPQEHINKIFDPFFTTKDIGKGTGLGLSIVYRIVENHQGSLEVSSRPKQGSTFTVRMPIQIKGDK